MDVEAKRRQMVTHQIIRRGIKDQSVIKVMSEIPREEFIPPEEREFAYDDRPIAIGRGQTISQPYMVALMSECLQLKKTDTVFEVGTGSGYQTAVLARLAQFVYSVERIEALARQAQRVLSKLNINNVKIITADGSVGPEGLEEAKSFDKIIVTAACPRQLDHLYYLLNEDGRMCVPIGTKDRQELMLYKKIKGEILEEPICPCIFVPLVGKCAWLS